MAEPRSTLDDIAEPAPLPRQPAPASGSKLPPPGVIVLGVLLAVLLVGLLWFFVLRDDDGGGDGDGASAETEQLLNDALAAHVDGQLGEATNLYQQVLAEDPENKFAHYNLGQIAQTEGRFEQAEASYRAALAIDPAYTPALFNLGILRFQASDFQGAIDLYRQLIVTDPNNASAHLNLGFALRAAGLTAQGDQSIATAVQIDPSLASQVPAPTDTTLAPASTEDSTTTVAP